jgi:hypothetical protein
VEGMTQKFGMAHKWCNTWRGQKWGRCVADRQTAQASILETAIR